MEYKCNICGQSLYARNCAARNHQAMASNYDSELNARHLNPFGLLTPRISKGAAGYWEFTVGMSGYETETDARRAWAFARKTSDDALVTGTEAEQKENGQGFVQHGLSKYRQEKSQAENPTSMTFEDCEDKSEHSPHFHNKNKYCDGHLWSHPKKQRIKEI